MDRDGGVSSDPGKRAARRLSDVHGSAIMSEKKKFLLRLDADVYNALEKWAADDLRSANAQIEFLLKDCVRKAGRLKERTSSSSDEKEEAR
jgi:hypothetical protein